MLNPFSADTVALVLTNQAEGWCLDRAEARPNKDADQWDSLDLHYIGRYDDEADVDPSDLLAVDGSPILYTGDGDWAVKTYDAERLEGPFYRGRVSCQGILADKGEKVRWTVGVEDSSAENILISGTIYPNVSSRLSKVGMELSWLQVGEPDDEAGDAGTSKVPPEPKPPSPTNIWLSLPEEQVNYHQPNGWVSDGVDAYELVPGSDLWFCVERFTYIFSITP